MLNFVAFITLFFLASCSSTPSRPELYPNETLSEKGPEVAQHDIDDCLNKANEYLKTPAGEKLKDSIGTSSLHTSVGFGFGSGGTGMGIGLGSRSSRLPRLSGEEQVRRNFTNQCLVNKGYQIVGWQE